jgi:UrcA family protein
MSHPNLALHAHYPWRYVPVLAVAIGAFALSSARAQAVVLKPIRVTAHFLSAPSALAGSKPAAAALLKPITILAPAARSVRTVGYDGTTGASIQEITTSARVEFNPVILTTYSGVALLKDDVAEAAQKACDSIEPLDGSEACVRRAIRSAQPQVTAAITRARGTILG